jgi:hypothetical protein
MVFINASVSQATECLLTPAAHTQTLGSSTLLSNAPTETAYRAELGLTSVNSISEADARELVVFKVTDESMAPSLQNGSMVSGKRLKIGELPRAGEVLVVYLPGDSGAQMGRFIEQSCGMLHLARNNGSQTISLPWEITDPTQPVYRITHYLSQPAFRTYF